MVNGTIIRKDFDNGGYGNYIIIKSDDGIGFLYAHMKDPSPLSQGDKVVVGQEVGHEGKTGHTTGIHLHIEMQDLSTSNWQFNADISTYLNPADYMGFPNTNGISVYYDGVPIFSHHKKGWRYIFMKKYRLKY